MVRSAIAELRSHPSRFTAVLLAIVLGVAFAAATLVFTGSVDSALRRSVAADVSKVQVVVTAQDGPLDLPGLSAVPGVRTAEEAVRTWTEFRNATGHGVLAMANVPAEPASRWYSLESGRWPAADNEMAVDSATAGRNSWTVGSTVTLGTPPDARPVHIVAILGTGISARAGTVDTGYGTLAMLQTQPPPAEMMAYLTLASGASPDGVADAINARFHGAVTARSAVDVAADAIRQLGGGTDVLTAILLAFVALAALVAAMVIANTFTILLTQRRRQIALLRCIGATGSQVRRSILAESALLAITGSVLGIGLGIGVGRIACEVAGIGGPDFAVDLASMVIVGVGGVALTVFSAFGPTIRASRLSPMDALQPIDADGHLRRVGRVRLASGAALLVGGGAVMAAGVRVQELTMAAGGGAITAVGVLLLLRVVLPGILRIGSVIGRAFGVPGRLAVANAVRNPARAAATCTALVVGVGSIVTLLVASASAKAGADQAVAARYALDLQVTARTGSIPASLLSALPSIDGVQHAVAVRGTTGTIDGSDYQIFGPSPEQLASVRNGGRLGPGEVALPAGLGAQLGVRPGDHVTVRKGSAAVSLTVVSGSVTDDGSVVVPAADLVSLDPAPRLQAVWAKFDPGAAANDVMARVNRVVAPFAEVDVSGGGVSKAATADLLNSVITVALALLSVAVVIAVVGVGNALGLSVIERTRESGLMRALGFRRGQLRAMLAIEASLLAVVAAVVGTFFGLLFGWAGAAAAFGQAGRTVVLSVPIGQLAGVALGAVLAGLIASVLPGRRAARTTPIAALAGGLS